VKPAAGSVVVTDVTSGSFGKPRQTFRHKSPGLVPSCDGQDRGTRLGWGFVRFEEELKTGSSARHADSVTAHAIASLSCLAVLASLIVGSQAAARAAASPSPDPGRLFGVHPVQQERTTLPGGHFNYALVPGQSISDGIVVENFSDHAISVHVYGADLITATGGGLAPAQPTATMREVGAWITVSTPIVMVPAHGQITDNFTVLLPTAVSSGQHLGAVVAGATVGLTTQGNPIEARVALITVVTVPGDAQASASLTPLVGSEAASGQIRFGITLSNTGNLLLTYTGSLSIDDGDGRRVATLQLTPTTAYVVPNGHVPLAAAWNETISQAAVYRAQATVTILANGVPVRTLTSQALALRFSSGSPLFLFAGVGLALVAMMLLATQAVRRRGRWKNGTRVRNVSGIDVARLR
jgi:hypothetical protein